MGAEDFFTKAKEDIVAAKEEHEELANVDEWKPKPNPSTLRGYFMKADRIPTQHGVRYKCYIKDFDTETTISVFCGPKLLQDGILDASPAVGSLIVFEYDGEHKGQSGFMYGGYYVRAEKSDEDYWRELSKPKPGEEEAMRRRAEQNAAASQSFTTGGEDDPY